jgi:hypothetical protein
MLRGDARGLQVVEREGRTGRLPGGIPSEGRKAGVHRASFKVIVDRPATTPKDEGQAAARPEVRASSTVVAASSVIERTSICHRAIRALPQQ